METKLSSQLLTSEHAREVRVLSSSIGDQCTMHDPMHAGNSIYGPIDLRASQYTMHDLSIG